MARKTEFTIHDLYEYDQSSVLRWVLSHIWRYRLYAIITLVCFLTAWIVYSAAQVLIGRAVESIITPTGAQTLAMLALMILVLLITDGVSMLIGNISAGKIAVGFESDAREELYASLIGKSKTFHDRQRVGDIMARATDDTQQLSQMIVPGTTLLFEVIMGLAVPIAFIATQHPALALTPLGFVVVYALLVWRYLRRLGPVIVAQREQFGKLNAGLEETISGIEVVKASAQELFERTRYRRNARQYRDLFVQQGSLEARYLPLLAYAVTFGLTFFHALVLYRQGVIDLGVIVATVGLLVILRFPTFISIYSFSLVQLGFASAGRILRIIRAETEMDENNRGHSATISGDIIFEQVSFSYEPAGQVAEQVPHVLHDISFRVAPGQTVAIVGQTGAGKSALTQLVNRTYDATAGRVLIDGVDVRDWSMEALRSQIGKIEQDVFLFSRSIADNIAFGAPGATQEQIEAAARSAQAHDFIMSFNDGYATVIGERGVTLSGGQRQRLALARAFLSNPRILVLDDSTSAIDSATEDQIQRAIHQARHGRTTLLITHRLSQIRWADLILVLDQGRLVAAGTHDELLRRSPHYRRIFARYGVELPPLEAASSAAERIAA